jgi:hypothetical protein
VRLYCYLCWMSDRKSSRQFKTTDKEIARASGISARSLTAARRNLLELRLITCDKVRGGGFTYTLCNVVTGNPYPGDPRAKISAQPEASPSQMSTPKDATVDWEPKPPNLTLDHEETDFQYGYNAMGTREVNVEDYSPFD